MSSEEKKIVGKLFLIVGPSGSGKGSVIEALKSHYRGFVYPVSYTTRAPREGEENGVVYNFVTKSEFEKMIKDDELLEYALVHSNNYYGTSKKDILDGLKNGGVVIREVDIQGFHSIKEIVPKENLVSIFMKVNDSEDLQSDLKARILRRGEMSNEELEKRLESAMKEIAQADECDYQVENKWGALKECVKRVEAIILDEIKDLY